MELYRHVLSEAVNHQVNTIYFAGTGEPLLNKHIFRMIHDAKDAGIPRVRMSTNGNLLNIENADALLSSGLDQLMISIDGVTPTTYKKIRVGGDLNVVENNVQNLIRLKKERNARLPQLEVQLIHQVDNDHEVEDFICHWQQYLQCEGDHLRIKEFQTQIGLIEDKRVEKRPITKLLCRKPWTELEIFWDGRVPLCCQDFHGRCIIGDVKRDSIKDIFNSNTIHTVRNELLSKKFSNGSLCKSCHGISD
jgi:MoaA/NifB/PqqE/SkfB family radical SAM enzyme